MGQVWDRWDRFGTGWTGLGQVGQVGDKLDRFGKAVKGVVPLNGIIAQLFWIRKKECPGGRVVGRQC